MKKLFLLILSLTLVAQIHAETDPKKALAGEYAKLIGIDEMVHDAKAATKKQGGEVAEKMFTQISTSMPGLKPETWDAIRAAAEKMIAKMATSWTADEAIAVWSDLYAKEFSEEELQRLIAESKTPFGQKQVAVARQASTVLQNFIMERGKSASEAAIADYVKELQEIVAKAAAERKAE